jgi:DNA polymerase III epsilon subunit family exonuclease
VQACPQGTLVDGALAYLARGPAESEALAREVLKLPAAPAIIAERVVAALLGADPRVTRLSDGRWAAVPAGATSPDLDACTFAVVDVETTGSRPARGDRVVEVAVVAVRGAAIHPVYETLVNPGRPLPPFVRSLTGIDDDLLRNQPVFADVADEIVAALSGRIFAAHNARFDWAFLQAEFRRTRDRALVGPRVCTVRLARRLLPDLASRGLDHVTRYFGIPVTRRHRAAGDAQATAAVLVRLIELARELGARTLDDLDRVSRRAPPARTAWPTQAEDIWPW